MIIHGECTECVWAEMIGVGEEGIADGDPGVRWRCTLWPPVPVQLRDGTVRSCWPLVSPDDKCSQFLPESVLEMVIEPITRWEWLVAKFRNMYVQREFDDGE